MSSNSQKDSSPSGAREFPLRLEQRGNEWCVELRYKMYRSGPDDNREDVVGMFNFLSQEAAVNYYIIARGIIEAYAQSLQRHPAPESCLHRHPLNRHCDICYENSLHTNQREMSVEPAPAVQTEKLLMDELAKAIHEEGMPHLRQRAKDILAAYQQTQKEG